MFKLYYSSPIDVCVDKAFKQIEEFKKILEPFTIEGCVKTAISNVGTFTYKGKEIHPIEVYGAGFGESLIITPESSQVYKGVVCSYDLRVLRNCDILLVVTDLKQFCAGTMMELEYARNLGIYTILFIYYDTPNEIRPKLKNIFLETYANKILYSKDELIEILEDLTK